MIDVHIRLLTIEMQFLGSTVNETHSMARLLSQPHFNETCDPRITFSKNDTWQYLHVKTLRVATRYLKNLAANDFIELEISKDSFTVNIMPFLTRLDELRAVHDERMKDIKDPFLTNFF